MALSLKKQCERARANWDATSTAFNNWAIANGFGNVRRNEMEKTLVDVPAGLTLLVADNAARAAWTEADNAAVAAGHAWRGTFGSVNFYSTSDMRRFAAQRRK
jgi:hypothetical protein